MARAGDHLRGVGHVRPREDVRGPGLEALEVPLHEDGGLPERERLVPVQRGHRASGALLVALHQPGFEAERRPRARAFGPCPLAHVERQRVVLAAVGLVGDDDDVVTVRQHRHRLAGFGWTELVDQREHVAVVRVRVRVVRVDDPPVVPRVLRVHVPEAVDRRVEPLAAAERVEAEGLDRLDLIAEEIDASLMSRYELIFSRRGGNAVVQVTGGICQGCYMNIPPQLWNEIIRSDKVNLCPSCQRILYYKAPQAQEKTA